MKDGATIPRWRALERDGVGHAFTSRKTTTPAVCGKPNQEERYDWKRTSTCEECSAALAAKEGRLL